MKKYAFLFVFVLAFLLPGSVSAQSGTWPTEPPTPDYCVPTISPTGTSPFPTADFSTPTPGLICTDLDCPTLTPTLSVTSTVAVTSSPTPSATPTVVLNPMVLISAVGSVSGYTDDFPKLLVTCDKPNGSYAPFRCDYDLGAVDNSSIIAAWVGFVIYVGDNGAPGTQYGYYRWVSGIGDVWDSFNTVTEPINAFSEGSFTVTSSKLVSAHCKSNVSGSFKGAFACKGYIEFCYDLASCLAYSATPTPTVTPTGTPGCVNYGDGNDGFDFTYPTIVPGACWVLVPSMLIEDIPLPPGSPEWIPRTIGFPGLELCTEYLVWSAMLFGIQSSWIISIICSVIGLSLIVGIFK